MHGSGANFGLLSMRLSLGAIMVIAGLGKCFGILGGSGIDGFAEYLAGSMEVPTDEVLGLPANKLMAWLVGIGELGGGAGVILGLLTRFSSFWLSVIMLGALYMFQHTGQLAFETSGKWGTSLACLGLSLGLLFLGSGGWAVMPSGGSRARHGE